MNLLSLTTFFVISSTTQFCCVLFLVLPTSGQTLLAWDGPKALNVDVWREKYVEVQLNSSFNLFGRGKFDRVFVNKIGALSFGSPAKTANLRDVRRDTILFSPMLIDMNELEHRSEVTIVTLQDTDHLSDVQRLIREWVGDSEVTLSQALAATFNITAVVGGKTQINAYQIILAGNKDRSYVVYLYNTTDIVSIDGAHARAGIFVLRDGAIECSHEVVGSGTKAMAAVRQHSNVDVAGAFVWRVDLPLECKAFRSECGEIPEAKPGFDLCPVGEFFETVTAARWRFYAFYFCKAGRTMRDGSVTAKRECRYDADYYTYEWAALADSQRCSKRIRNFWSNFHASRSVR